MAIIRHTRAAPGHGSTSLGRFIGRSIHYIIAPSLSEMGQFARESNLPKKNSGGSWWDLGISTEQAISMCFTGDTSAVEASDALLSKMEEHTNMPSTRSIWYDDVSGAFPNIPAYIAGQPLNMRQRQKVQIDSAPLAIMVDLSVSGAINAQQVRNRGVAILALTRALSAHRPIELWAMDLGAADEGRGTPVNCVVMATKIETSPLDLSAASYALCHPGFLRQLYFPLESKHHGFIGGWPFNNNSRALTAHETAVIIAPMFTHVAETLCLPGLHVADKSMTDPEAWLRTQLSIHDPLRLEESKLEEV